MVAAALCLFFLLLLSLSEAIGFGVVADHGDRGFSHDLANQTRATARDHQIDVAVGLEEHVDRARLIGRCQRLVVGDGDDGRRRRLA